MPRGYFYCKTCDNVSPLCYTIHIIGRVYNSIYIQEVPSSVRKIKQALFDRKKKIVEKGLQSVKTIFKVLQTTSNDFYSGYACLVVCVIDWYCVSNCNKEDAE